MNRESLITALGLGPDVLEGFVADLPEGAVDRSRGGAMWTVRDHLAHLADVQPMLHHRIEIFRDEVRPVMTPWDPSKEDGDARRATDVENSLERFRSWRERQVGLLDDLEDAVWSRTGVHPEYDSYTLDILASHILFHDGFHLYRMEEMAFVRSPFLTRLP